jgi:hypothetical protein
VLLAPGLATVVAAMPVVTGWTEETILSRILLLGAALVTILSPASAQQPRPSAPPQVGERTAVNSLNLTLDSSKMHFCFWESAVYSPGSLVIFVDTTKNSSICFHCNADGTWDKPCQ